MDPKKYVGCAPAQVTAYLDEEVKPLLEKNREFLGMKAEINV